MGKESARAASEKWKLGTPQEPSAYFTEATKLSPGDTSLWWQQSQVKCCPAVPGATNTPGNASPPFLVTRLPSSLKIPSALPWGVCACVCFPLRWQTVPFYIYAILTLFRVSIK